MRIEKRQPARIIKRSTVKNICKVPSHKYGGMVICESLLEAHFCSLANIDPRVLYFCPQPFHVDYYPQGKKRRFTPDIYMKTTYGDVIVEVKLECKANSDMWQDVFLSVAPILHEAGYEFVIATEKEIQLEPRFTNLQILERYWRIMFTHRDQADALSYLSKRGVTSIEEMMGYFYTKGSCPEMVYSLIYWGVLSVDIMKPLNKTSAVWLPGRIQPGILQTEHFKGGLYE
jgi:hypothetical protein